MKKLYFLGPNGTYSEQAALKIQKIIGKDYFPTPISTIAKAIQFASQNPTDAAILPIENSIEGIVRQTIDNIYINDISIQAQIDIDINHCLISKGKKSEIEHIISHPQALAQCSKYILDNFNEKIDLIESPSTSASYFYLEKRSNAYGAIVSSHLAQKGNCNIIDTNIGDIKENKTRFVLLSKNCFSIKEKTRTSIVFNTKNEPGALLKILEIIHKNNLNLIYLESRPSKKVFGEYNFFADIDRGEKEIASTLIEIKNACNYYKLLGSYCEL